AGEPACAGAGGADLEDVQGMVAIDARRAFVGRSSGAGGEIRAAHRGTDRVSHNAAFDVAGAGRYDPDERPVPGLIAAGARRGSEKRAGQIAPISARHCCASFMRPAICFESRMSRLSANTVWLVPASAQPTIQPTVAFQRPGTAVSSTP